MSLLLLIIRREEEETHPGAEEEEERVVLKLVVFILVVVVVDLIIVILFLVCRVAQKQLLDAILIILCNTKLFFTLVSSIQESCKVWERKKEKRKKKEKNENEEREKFSREKLGFRNRRSQISLLLLPDCFSDKSISKVLLFKHRTTRE